MINFRFHLVSLIAVFLAMGLGIVVGSTVVDQKIVNRLDSEIHGVQNAIKERNSTNRQLANQNQQLQQFVASLAPYAGDGRLIDQPVAVVVETGVDRKDVTETVDALRQAGAVVPGALWLQDSWQLDTNDRLEALQTALGLHGTDSATRTAAFDQLASRLARPESTGTKAPARARAGTTTTTAATTTTTIPVPADALTALEGAGFLRVTDGDASAFDTFPSHAANALVITGDDSHFVGSGLAASFVRSLIGANVPTEVAAVYDAGNDPSNAPDRGAVLASVLDDQSLSRSVSTVDDLELPQGRIAAVLALALQISGGGNIGHYGYGAGASASLPPRRS